MTCEGAPPIPPAGVKKGKRSRPLQHLDRHRTRHDHALRWGPPIDHRVDRIDDRPDDLEGIVRRRPAADRLDRTRDLDRQREALAARWNSCGGPDRASRAMSLATWSHSVRSEDASSTRTEATTPAPSSWNSSSARPTFGAWLLRTPSRASVTSALPGKSPSSMSWAVTDGSSFFDGLACLVPGPAPRRASRGRRRSPRRRVRRPGADPRLTPGPARTSTNHRRRTARRAGGGGGRRGRFARPLSRIGARWGGGVCRLLGRRRLFDRVARRCGRRLELDLGHDRRARLARRGEPLQAHGEQDRPVNAERDDPGRVGLVHRRRSSRTLPAVRLAREDADRRETRGEVLRAELRRRDGHHDRERVATAPPGLREATMARGAVPARGPVSSVTDEGGELHDERRFRLPAHWIRESFRRAPR